MSIQFKILVALFALVVVLIAASAWMVLSSNDNVTRADTLRTTAAEAPDIPHQNFSHAGSKLAIHQLTERLSRIEDSMEKRKSDDSAEGSQDAEKKPKKERSISETIKKSAERAREKAEAEKARLDRTLARGKDSHPEWSKRYVENLTRAFETPDVLPPEIHLEAIRCRSLVCRLELTFDDELSRNAIVDRLPFELQQSRGETAFWKNEGGDGEGWRTVYYVMGKPPAASPVE